MFAFKNVPIPSAPLSKNNGPSLSAIRGVHVFPVKICNNPDSCGGEVKAFRARFQIDEVSVSGLTGFVWTEDRLDKYVGCQKYPNLCGS